MNANKQFSALRLHQFFEDAFEYIGKKGKVERLYELPKALIETHIDKTGTIRRVIRVRITSTSDSCNEFLWVVPLHKSGQMVLGLIAEDTQNILDTTIQYFPVEKWPGQVALIKIKFNSLAKGKTKSILFEYFIVNYLITHRKKTLSYVSEYVFNYKIASPETDLSIRTCIPPEAVIKKIDPPESLTFSYQNKILVLLPERKMKRGESLICCVKYITPTIYTSILLNLVPSLTITGLIGLFLSRKIEPFLEWLGTIGQFCLMAFIFIFAFIAFRIVLKKTSL